MPQTLESWFPRWAHELAAAHAGGTSQTFVLHGNVDDLIRTERRGEIAYTMLPEFLAGQLFGGWDVVLVYDQVHGPRALAATPARLEKINQLIERFIGPVETLRATRAPAQALVVLHRFLELALLREGERPSVALILEYAQLLAPAAAGPYTSRELAANLATLLSWAKSPYFKRAPFAFCLISERLSDLHGSLVQSAHTVKLELTHPGRTERLAFLRHAL
ncbi:MAG: hypothetical protein FJ125_00815, partial [Deltaproteobacteria bacterium]|nr:hypothetical protein [Deltaproteobacteria bacterium]